MTISLKLLSLTKNLNKMKEISIIQNLESKTLKVKEAYTTTWDYLIPSHDYVVMNIKELTSPKGSYFVVEVQDLTSLAIFNMPLYTLHRSKGNFAVAVFQNKDVPLFGSVFTLVEKHTELKTLNNGVKFADKIYTFKFLYEL